MKTQILTDEQFNSPENQNRDNAIIGYRSIENGTKPLNIAVVSKAKRTVCRHRGDARINPQGREIYCLDCGERVE